ncbi:hypothetical protein CC79DRAFT_1399908 [Sarocladium strictum]
MPVDIHSWLVIPVDLESGNREGCDRCRTSSADCTYALADIGTGRRRPRRIPTTPATSSSRSSRVSSRPSTAPLQTRINGDQTDLVVDPYATSRSSPHAGEGDSDGGIPITQHQQQLQQANGGDLPHSATDTLMQDWDDLAWDDSLFSLDHPLSGANVYNYLNVSEPFTNHRDPVLCPPGSLARWPGSSQQPVSETLALQRMPQQALKESQLSARRQECDCLGALVKVLENIGKSQTQSEWTGIDMQLMSLWQAMHTCHQVIACNTCSTCSDSPVLVATIIQLFAGISDELGSICGRTRASSHPQTISKDEEMAVGTVWIAIVAGQNLYIVGGAVSYRAGGNVVRKLFVNTTLSLPLDQDWKASDVSYKSFPPPDSISHSLYDAGLWVNDESEKDANPDVYLWGGSYYRENEPGHERDRNLWTMQTKADGTGNWGKASVPTKIKQTGAGTAASCGGKGYMIGGWGSNDTDPNFSKVEGGMINVPGLISYDFTSSDWNNHSIEALTQAKLGTYADGAAICVKMAGTSPKLFVVGGTVNSEPSG